jgi:hypothetical protein
MSMAYKIHKTYDDSASSIYQECSDTVSNMLGAKRSLSLYFSVFLSSFVTISSAIIITAIVMMLYGSYVTTLHPSSIASFLLIYALFVAASSTVSAVIRKKAGRHFFLNCKHCILSKGKNLTPDEEIDIMNDITVLQDLLINRWASQSSYAVTEVIAIICILFFDASLFGYACLLFAISKLLSTCEDWIHLREQVSRSSAPLTPPVSSAENLRLTPPLCAGPLQQDQLPEGAVRLLHGGGDLLVQKRARRPQHCHPDVCGLQVRLILAIYNNITQ